MFSLLSLVLLVLALVLETLAPGRRLGTSLHCHPWRKAKLPQEATPSSPDHPIGTTFPSSSSLVHFSNYTTLKSCHLLEIDLGMHKDLWRFSLIGYIAGKFLG